MEDYSVGSLAALISGKKSKNKGKVVQKEQKVQKVARKFQEDDDETDLPSKKKKLHHQNKIVDTNMTGKKKNKNKEQKNLPNKANGSQNGKGNKSKKSKQTAEDLAGTDDSSSEDENVNDSEEEVDFQAAVDLLEKEASGDEEDESEQDDSIVKDKSQSASDESDNDSETEQEGTKKVERVPLTKEEEAERNARTVFVGNVPVTVTKSILKKMFMKYGKVDSLRLRSIAVNDTRVPKKVAMIKKDLHPSRKSLHAYIRYQTREEALKALQADRIVFQNHHLRVNMADAKNTHDENKAIFVGNIPFDAEDEEMWKIFIPCGNITSVRLVRDGRTMIGKGFGYVNFESSDSVELALQLEEPKLKGRVLRLKRCDTKVANKNKKSKSFSKFNKGEKQNQGERVRPTTVREKIFQGKTANKKKDKKMKKKANTKKVGKQLGPKINTASN